MSADLQQYNREPKKSILKLPDRPLTEHRKSAHWDENNLQNTLYAENEGFGFVNGELTNTSDWESNGDFNEESMPPSETGDSTDRNLLTEPNHQQNITMYQEKALKKKAFEEKRKAHYNEFKASQAAKDLMKHYEEDEEEGADAEENKPTEDKRNKDYSYERRPEKAEKTRLLPEEWEQKRPKIEKIPNTHNAF